MALEDLTGASKFIDDLVNTNPVGSTDAVSTVDDHIRGIKNVLLNSFPGVTGAVTATHTELNVLDGASVTTADLTKLGSVTATAAELNLVDGLTSSLSGLTASAAELNLLDGVPAGLTTTEIGYLDGVTSAIQTQLNARAIPPAALANHIRAGSTQIIDGEYATLTEFNISSLTRATWLQIGPTGSGAADYTWTALPAIPSTATILILRVRITLVTNSTDLDSAQFLAVKGDDATPAFNTNNVKAYAAIDANSASAQLVHEERVFIPLDSNQRFKGYWTDGGAPTSTTVALYYEGFMTD